MEIPTINSPTPTNTYPITLQSAIEPINVTVINIPSPTASEVPPNPTESPATDYNSGVSTSAEESLDFPWLNLDSNQSDFEDYYLNVYQSGEGIGDIYRDNERKQSEAILED